MLSYKNGMAAYNIVTTLPQGITSAIFLCFRTQFLSGYATTACTTSSAKPTQIRTTPTVASFLPTLGGWWCANTRTSLKMVARWTWATWPAILSYSFMRSECFAVRLIFLYPEIYNFICQFYLFVKMLSIKKSFSTWYWWKIIFKRF